MNIYIGIEDLVANALIELVERTGRKEVLFKELDEYGAYVVGLISRDGDKQAILILSTERTNEFFHDYSTYFELCTNGSDKGVRLKEGVTASDLWAAFRNYLSIDLLRAFTDEGAVELLGVKA